MPLVYFFGERGVQAERSPQILGGKGAGLAEMSQAGLAVPPGFTISTEVCTSYLTHKRGYPQGLEKEVKDNLRRLEETLGCAFGDGENPLLLSIRSGASVSMPGMLDTVLNIGLNDDTVHGLVKRTGDERFAFDTYRRFVQMYANVVMGVRRDALERVIEEAKRARKVESDAELAPEELRQVVQRLKEEVKQIAGAEIPWDPREQLWNAIRAVFESWNNPRAITYRRLNSIPSDLGTAVTVQAMVFGNLGENSSAGVAFTRDPATGKKKVYGEFLINAQGEDIVAGVRTPRPIIPELKMLMPQCYRQMVETSRKLEKLYKEMQDFEFTIQEGKLWLLQTRQGKRTAQAAVKIAVDMVKEGMIDQKEALRRIDPGSLDQLLHPVLDPKAEKKVIARGLASSPGAACGKAVLTIDSAMKLTEEEEKVILVRNETSADDIAGIDVAQGVLTARGGVTSHAAVVTRAMGKCSIVGCNALSIDLKQKRFSIGDSSFGEGEVITLDGTTGEVMLGEVPLILPEVTGDLRELVEWADEIARLRVRANVDNPRDARIAKEFGAEGIGLCRTEHMFLEGKRINVFRELILAADEEEREKALAELLPMLKASLSEILQEMEGLPVIIRLLDPPLHEFLPRGDDEYAAREIGIPLNDLRRRVDSFAESNPMLGHRGCRLGITFEAIYEVQVRAIAEAACDLIKRGYKVMPGIMIPLVSYVEELRSLKRSLVRICEDVSEEQGVEKLHCSIGVMIETPRAAIAAYEIAQVADFFSFGTNDLTQTVLSISRDDSGRFLPTYLEKGILEEDPFVTLDKEGVGYLIRLGVEKGRQAKPDLEIGICGEHGGDPRSIEFFNRVGLDYVSCSPYRVSIAKLAAAQAVLKLSNGDAKLASS